MTEVSELVKTLHPLERKVLPHLSKCNNLDELMRLSKLSEVEAMRALQWLQNKKVLVIKTETKAIISLDKNGLRYKDKGLPELNFLKAIVDKPLSLKEIQEKAGLDRDELTISIGILKKKALITLSKEVSLTEQGEKYLKKASLEEQFLSALPLTTSELIPEQGYAYNELTKRKEIIKTDIKKLRTFELTELGEELVKEKLDKDYIEVLTPKILKSDLWKKTKFRHYDIQSIVPRVYAGKKHPVNQAIEYMRRIWLGMGFEEMDGPIMDTSFWIFDALFTAQDHPVREMQDTFFIKNPEKGVLPDKELVSKVKKTHEDGWETGSKGWKYKWDEEEAKRNVLRTHTTGLSVRTISQLKRKDLPKKFFNIGKVFRNETLDWSHLFEFYQTEGIVVGEDLNLKHLLGYLKEFFTKMGFEKIRFRPAFFSYTEPSVECDVYHPVKKTWIELGGAGIFRPEVVVPLLGKDIPVLAWGLGVERIVTLYYEINDLRDLYKNDIKKLREFGVFLK
ncbi:MAG: phenylalanine--tRNA ligase subunit alpha [Candidatus Woesearchaeota archaeon]